jgi:hypothetical protein
VHPVALHRRGIPERGDAEQSALRVFCDQRVVEREAGPLRQAVLELSEIVPVAERALPVLGGQHLDEAGQVGGRRGPHA